MCRLMPFFFYFFTSIAFSIAQDYFPLQVGNVWYHNSTATLIDSSFVKDGYTFFRSTKYGGHYRYYRQDNLGNVYSGVDSGGTLLFDFSAPEGASWNSTVVTQPVVCQMLSRDDTISTPAGTFYPCLHIRYIAQQISDAIDDFWFAEGIGVVQKQYLWQQTPSKLQKARLDGRVLPLNPSPLQLAGSIPADGQVGVPPQEDIEVQLNFDVPSRYFCSKYISVIDSGSGPLSGLVSGVASTFEFYPDNLFGFKHKIQVVLSDSIADYLGQRLSGRRSVSFTTLDSTLTLINAIPIFGGINYYTRFACSDMDGDGDQDLALYHRNRLSFYINENNRFYSRPQYFEISSMPSGSGSNLTFLNLDGARGEDLVLTVEESESVFSTHFFIQGGDSFLLDSRWQLPEDSRELAWKDINFDALPDLVVLRGKLENPVLSVYMNSGSQLNLAWEKAGISTQICAVQWMDANGDGFQDILGISSWLDSNEVWLGNGSGFDLVQPLQVGFRRDISPAANFETADINQDGRDDFILDRYLFVSSDQGYHLQDSFPDRIKSMHFERMNDDLWTDLIGFGDKWFSNTYSYFYSAFNQHGTFPIVKEEFLGKTKWPDTFLWRDMDNDGRTDLIVSTYDTLYLYPNKLNYVSGGQDTPKADSLRIVVYPNPTIGPVVINAGIKYPQKKALVRVFDILGRRVRTLHPLTGGKRIKFRWDGKTKAGSPLATGLYFIVLHNGGEVRAAKLVIL